MRLRPAAVLLVLAALAPPSAAAATFDLGAERILERALLPDTDAAFEMPIHVNQDGFLYAKVLPTPGNAANNGSGPNGSIDEGTGWGVRFAFVGPDGARTELGAFLDSTPTPLVQVRAGDDARLVITVRIPADAALGGPRQALYVALAYRAGDASGSTGASGASIDEARALTLLLTNDLLPPAAPPVPDPPASDAEADVPPVGPIAESTGGTTVVNVAAAQTPDWFYGGILALAALGLVVLGSIARSLRAIAAGPRAPVAAPAPARRIPVVAPGPRSILVVDDAATSRLLLQRLLEAELGPAADVRVVADAKGAMDAFHEHEPEVVFMDLALGSADGAELARRMLAARPATRIVVATSDEPGARRVRAALDAGVVGVLHKPLRVDRLREVLAALREAPGERVAPDGA